MNKTDKIKNTQEIIEGVLIISYKKLNQELYFLLLKHKGGFWTFPGGAKDDEDDTIKDCAQREIKEEIGLDIKKENLIDTGIRNEFIYGSEKPVRAGKKGMTHVFVSEIMEEKFSSFHNIEKVEWLTKNEILEKLEFEDIKNLFNKAFDYITKFSL